MSIYKGYAPLFILKPVAPEVWIVDGPEIRFKLGILRIPFPTRMTVVRLPSGGLWLHSPIAFDASLGAALRELGPVAHIVAPNTIHYWWVGDWSSRFPAAEVWAVPRLAPGATARVPAHSVLGGKSPPAWEEMFDQLLVSGTRLVEADFFHRPSRTLILTDLIENFEAHRFSSIFYRWLARIGGTVDPDGRLPFELRRSFPRQELRAAIEQMLAWWPERIIVAHGRSYVSNAVAELRRAFRWAL